MQPGSESGSRVFFGMTVRIGTPVEISDARLENNFLPFSVYRMDDAGAFAPFPVGINPDDAGIGGIAGTKEIVY